jgi:hypothetical protein
MIHPVPYYRVKGFHRFWVRCPGRSLSIPDLKGMSPEQHRAVFDKIDRKVKELLAGLKSRRVAC